MNPAINPKLVISRYFFGDEGQRDVGTSVLETSEIFHDFSGPDLGDDLEDAVNLDNPLARQCSRSPKDEIAVISLAGVDHMIYIDRGRVFALSAFNNSVYLGSTEEQVRKSIRDIRGATTFRLRAYS